MPCEHGKSIDAAIPTDATLSAWIVAHPYLGGIVRFQQVIRDTFSSYDAGALPAPSWTSYADDYGRGIPLLKSRPLDMAIVTRAGNLLSLLTDKLSGVNQDEISRAAMLLRDEFQRSPESAAVLLDQIVSNQAHVAGQLESANPGFVRYLCWRALECVLRPLVQSFSLWRDDAQWGRPYCPFCGSLPSMAQLVNTQRGHERFLSCGCCRSRWSYRRAGCPFCENHDCDTLEILELEQEENFRIDVCRECNGYLKTYTAEGDEELLLSDWSTLHLDILAQREGFQRRAGSLYEL